MLIDCPGCGKSYHIIKATLGSSGRRVVCPRCDSIWFVPVDDLPVDLDAAEPDFAEAAPFADFAEPLSAVSPAIDRPAKFGGAAAQGVAPTRALTVRRRASSLFRSGFYVLAVSMALLGCRAQIVRLYPRAATAYAALGLPVNLRGLTFQNVHTTTIRDGSETVLGIEGEITNLRGQAAPIPALRLAVRDAKGREIYSWTVPAQTQRLDAYATTPFRARLAAPPQAGRDVLITFVSSPTKRTQQAKTSRAAAARFQPPTAADLSHL